MNTEINVAERELTEDELNAVSGGVTCAAGRHFDEGQY
jgi:bacteriocin-like protein